MEFDSGDKDLLLGAFTLPLVLVGGIVRGLCMPVQLQGIFAGFIYVAPSPIYGDISVESLT
jgi:hypothetical protein